MSPKAFRTRAPRGSESRSGQLKPTVVSRLIVQRLSAIEKEVSRATIRSDRDTAVRLIRQLAFELQEAEPIDLRLKFGPSAKQIKLGIQMVIGIIGGIFAIALPIYLYATPPHDPPKAQSILGVAATTLAFATIIELSYSFFAISKDDLIDAAALALSSAIVLQLAHVEQFNVAQSASAAIYAAALGILFYLRKFIHQSEDDTYTTDVLWRSFDRESDYLSTHGPSSPFGPETHRGYPSRVNVDDDQEKETNDVEPGRRDVGRADTSSTHAESDLGEVGDAEQRPD